VAWLSTPVGAAGDHPLARGVGPLLYISNDIGPWAQTYRFTGLFQAIDLYRLFHILLRSMTVHIITPLDRILVRATALEVFPAHCKVGIPISRSAANGQHTLTVDHTEIVVRDLQASYEVIRLMRRQIANLCDTVLRLEAEVYEAGGTPLLVIPLIRDDASLIKA